MTVKNQKAKQWIKENRLVLVEWVDSMGQHGWRDYERLDITCHTVGMFYKEEDDRVVLAMNKSGVDSQSQYGDYMSIPKGVIQKITNLDVKGGGK